MVRIGDRVEMLMDEEEGTSIVFKGERGTIVGINRTSRGNYFAVRLDGYNSQRHNCLGLTEFGHGFYVSASEEGTFFRIITRKRNNLLT